MLIVCFLGTSTALAHDFVNSLDLAIAHDRTFQTAIAERDLAKKDADRAGLVYFPSASFERGRSPFESKDRTTAQITQPILDMDRYAAYQEIAGKVNFAQATFEVKQLELARKVYKIVASLVQLKQLQSLALSEAKDLERQAQRATRRFELGNGTVMDVTTAQVQHAQALARYQSLQAEIGQAEEKYFSVTSQKSVSINVMPDYERAAAFVMPELRDAEELPNNPLVEQARAQLELAQFGLIRAKSAYVPVVSAIVRNSEFKGEKDTYLGFQISTPTGLSAYTLSAKQRAELDIKKAQATLDEALEQARMDAASSGFAVQAYAREMVYRNTAVKVSQATVSMTEKAYEAGLVKASDVVSAILASFEVQRQRLSLLMNLAEFTLQHQLIKGVSPQQSMSVMQKLFVIEPVVNQDRSH